MVQYDYNQSKGVKCLHYEGNVILRNPSGVRQMAAEMKKLVDMYWSRRISEKEAIEIIIYWATNYPQYIFRANDYNPSIRHIVGKKRLAFVDVALQGFQTKFQ